MITKKYPPHEAARSEPAPSEPDIMNPEPQAGTPTPAVEQPKRARYIAVRATAHGTRSYSVGEVLELELAEAQKLNSWPAGFMPTTLEGGPQGTIQVPIFFCLRECSRGGKTYSPGELWDRPQEPAPEGLFVPWEQRSEYEFISVSGVQRAELHRKASVDPGPNRPAA